ncbi:hypothetical protein [Polyangium sp. 6x1]|uniref:hypothetical protein n=1 Tax=Polyangium sp. 6x1 TaxID=3042689 RepID=UPI0024824D1A|nr:hypothetical protein [Polyangium sp. 6x1]MDI1442639.1 hypothetical protein [Polyangium sp. 6x1]
MINVRETRQGASISMPLFQHTPPTLHPSGWALLAVLPPGTERLPAELQAVLRFCLARTFPLVEQTREGQWILDVSREVEPRFGGAGHDLRVEPEFLLPVPGFCSTFEVVVASDLDASPARIWERVATFEGVNDELGPWLKMSTAPGTSNRLDEGVPLGKSLFRSWLLLGGLLPVEYDDLCFSRLESGRGFLETSSMGTQLAWVHERTLEPVGSGARARLTDRLRFTPRWGALGRPSRLLVTGVFTHRHARLRARFGGEPARIPA